MFTYCVQLGLVMTRVHCVSSLDIVGHLLYHPRRRIDPLPYFPIASLDVVRGPCIKIFLRDITDLTPPKITPQDGLKYSSEAPVDKIM